jgi:hypothetical protein
MRGKYKVGLSILGIVLIAVLAYNVIVHSTLFFAFSPVFMPSKDAIEKSYEQNKADLLIVAEYVKSMEYDSIYISSNDGTVFVSDSQTGSVGTNIEIDDPMVTSAANHLFQASRYNMISAVKNEFIAFQTWSTRDKGCGIAYSLNGNEPAIEFLTELAPLSELGWYYYVSDFDEYRRNK